VDTSGALDSQRAIIEAVKANPAGRVKVAVADIDGILRGKVIHVDKFTSAAEGGLGFSVFGYDLNDRPIENLTSTGKRFGFPDAEARLDLGTYRTVPWDNNVPFFLGEFVNPDGSGHALCPRQLLKRVLQRAEKMGFKASIGSEFEFFNFNETQESWAEKQGVGPEPITHGMFGLSLVRAAANQEYFNALWNYTTRFGIPLESLHTETGPGVYEVAILFGDALEAADRATLFKDTAKEIGARFGIMPSFMAKWHSKYPGCSGHIHQSLSDGSRNVFYDEKGRHGGMSGLFESYVAGQVEFLMKLGPMFWPTINSYKRLVEGFWAPVKPTWAVDNRTAAFRVLPGSAKATRLETRGPGADINPYLAIAAILAAGLAGIEKGLELTAQPVTGDNEGAEDVPSAPRTLIEATAAFKQSDVARDWFGDEFVEYFAASREWEWRLWLDAVTDWERKRYFEII
jgi:glutamine synthetase